MRTVYRLGGIPDGTLVWENGIISSPDLPGLDASVSDLLKDVIVKGNVYPASPTGPFYSGMDIRLEPLGFLAFIQEAFPGTRVVGGEIPQLPYDPDVVY